MIQQAGTARKCCRSLVFKWHRQFKDGRESVEDETRCGRPANVTLLVVVFVLLFHVHGKHLRSCLDGQLT